MNTAEDAMEQQDYERALANVDSAIAQDSANVDAYKMKARILRQMADSTVPPEEYKNLYSRAREAEEKAIEFNPGERSSVQEQRDLAYIQEYQKGADAFNAAQKSRAKEDYLKAAAFFGAAGAIKPDSTGPILNEAYARLRAARLEEGEKVVEEMNQVIPILERYIEKEDQPTKNAYTILAQLYLQDDRPEETVEVTEQAIEDLSSRPTHFQISGTQKVQYTGTVEVDGSSRSVEGTVPDRIEISSSDGMVSGSFYKEEGGKRQTKGRLQVSLFLQGTQMGSDQTTTVEDTLMISEDLTGQTPLAELQNFRLNALNQTGDTERAMQAYQEQIKQNPENATYRYNYGSLLLNDDRYDEAAEQLEVAVEHDPKDPKKWYNLGAAYLNKGVVFQDSLVSVRDSLVEREQEPTEEERKMVKELAQERLSYFQDAIPPLEKARELSSPGGQYRESACTALFQAYVQTEQTKKAQEVKQCAGQDVGSQDEDGN